ncbi:AbrB/MazE/SpoVT family DNA-binding domain-containing protein [Domibacillus sp. 8LH]|uniref:AbrB/MazE/SpoVT family DNA-binding domain-containing protein n=1 Tax=unclassified Domibacillus TaxID=2632383 RepID=UPI0028E3D7EE|nr:AbrB/MazE/SpoVT family DNA-binding domain-containing protein [Domibacillus sp. DTU_2020_1001157_1_SI_ALB_TIR_016]WNS81391.1 AbrB/MazE/SpoVT family DNA-binding domain-containing protein [Domibacillus sp. DTU_2020_1001157_1_SI_ALB_TIR_016]
MIAVKSKRIMDAQGRVVLPKAVRKELGISPEDRVRVVGQQDEITIEKYTEQQVEETQMCYITGAASPDCHSFSGGIHLSKEAALKILAEWKSKQ